MVYRHLRDLPITGKHPVEPQATVNELSDLIMPVISHEEITEMGFSVTHLSMDSDPEIYEVRNIWVRTIQDVDRAPHELGLWGEDHPTLGDILFGEATNDLGRRIDSWWNALRDSCYRDAILASFGYGDVKITKEEIVVSHEFHPFEKDWR